MNKLSLSPTLRRILLEAVILCVVAMAVGLSLNFGLVFNAFSGKTTSVPVAMMDPAGTLNRLEPDAEDPFPVPVELAEIDALLADGAVLVDARSHAAYREAHIAGAISLPLAEYEDGLAAFEKRFPFDSILVIYCSGYGCSDSFDLGVLLLKEGYSDVLVYEGGFPEWRDSGRLLERELE